MPAAAEFPTNAEFPTDAELLAYLAEQLAVDRMAAMEQALRTSAELRLRLTRLLQERETEGDSLGKIWRRERLSCPTRHQLGSYLLGALPAAWVDYIRFHLDTIGCRYCAANLADLQQASAQQTQSRDTAAQKRREKIYQSSLSQLPHEPP